ncbi:hypothetical protein F2Q69_00061908 [Brassica cretica]|uniref:Uncharacterized protein n=1 Tax=Brassica cretica TaxID=69181 RepID=A0A8S9RNV4_BRACR|nr:hypothetical protein F2Q69_00061908 [Brassica cretica]
MTSFRAFSNCLRVISSGASTVARSAASSAVNREIGSPNNQIQIENLTEVEPSLAIPERVFAFGEEPVGVSHPLPQTVCKQ